jgi:hypothetical protein
MASTRFARLLAAAMAGAAILSLAGDRPAHADPGVLTRFPGALSDPGGFALAARADIDRYVYDVDLSMKSGHEAAVLVIDSLDLSSGNFTGTLQPSGGLPLNVSGQVGPIRYIGSDPWWDLSFTAKGIGVEMRSTSGFVYVNQGGGYNLTATFWYTMTTRIGFVTDYGNLDANPKVVLH